MSVASLGSTLSLLALVPRSLTPSEAQKTISQAKAQVEKELGACQMTSSQAWFSQQFARCGNWESWIWETVSGRDYNTRKAHFKGFVVCGTPELSRANAGIVSLALRNDRVVLFWEADQSLKLVVNVVEVDPEDFSAGWRVNVKPLEG